MSKIKNDGLDQYDIDPFKQQQFGTGGVEVVNISLIVSVLHSCLLILHGALCASKDLLWLL